MQRYFCGFDSRYINRAALIVNDGQRVEAGDYLAGDIVCELDSSALVESELNQQIKVTAALASREKAETNGLIQESTNEKFMAAAKLAETLAGLDLKAYTAVGIKGAGVSRRTMDVK